MKKGFKYYAIVWAVLLALFNVVAFVSVGWIGVEKYTPSFWLGYGFITAFFVGQLGCAAWVFKTDSSQKLFYNISVLRHSYIGLIVSFVVGGACMLISPLPWWIGTLICAVVLATNVITVTKAAAVVALVDEKAQNICRSTAFIKGMTADAEALLARATTGEAKAACTNVYEAFRYSDPVSMPEVEAIESDIQTAFRELENVVLNADKERVSAAAREVTELVAHRNAKCKACR